MFSKKLILIACFIAAVYCCTAQTYISLVPSVLNIPGTLGDKSNISFELGRQWDVFSLGADIGRGSLSRSVGRDTTFYVEIRPNLNIFQQGKFTNTLTPGIGYVFNARENLVTELTTGIEYACTPLIHFNILFGQYYYSGKVSASTATFFGVSVMKYFSPSKSKALISNKP